jgi:osmotically inducible lipoprotein OsmB
MVISTGSPGRDARDVVELIPVSEFQQRDVLSLWPANVIHQTTVPHVFDLTNRVNGRDPMKRALALIFVVALLATAGCANMTPRQQRALSGGAIGAAGGAALGAITGGSPALGAAIGGAAGAATGALIK